MYKSDKKKKDPPSFGKNIFNPYKVLQISPDPPFLKWWNPFPNLFFFACFSSKIKLYSNTAQTTLRLFKMAITAVQNGL